MINLHRSQGFVLVMTFGICIGMSGSAYPRPGTSGRSPASPSITGIYAEKRVTQVCLIQTTLTQGDPSISAVKGDVAICSGTLISPTQVLTAAHCAVEPKNTVVTCSCGESDHQKSTEYSVEAAGEIHPDYFGEKENFRKVDAQLVTLGTKMRSDCSGPGVKPMDWISSPEQIKQSLASGHCYLSGWGLDNGQSSTLRAALIPRGNQIDSYPIPKSNFNHADSSVDVVTFYNDAYRSRMSAEQDRIKASLSDGGASISAVDQLASEQMKQYDRMMSFLSGDPNRHNAIRQGDSGGAAFCTDAAGIDRLVGIIHSEWQEAVLTSSPVMSAWLEKRIIRSEGMTRK